VRRTRAERAARRRQLRQAVLAGATPADVAAQYGVNRNLVYAACGRGELHAAAVRRRRELAALVQRGMSPKEVARTTGVSVTTVYVACHRNGVKVRHDPGSLSPAERDARASRRPQTLLPSQWRRLDWMLRNADLARQLGISGERVRQKRMELGMPKVPRKKRD